MNAWTGDRSTLNRSASLQSVLGNADIAGRSNADPVPQGRLTLLLGPPSCGKSTLLKVLSGRLKETATMRVSCEIKGSARLKRASGFHKLSIMPCRFPVVSHKPCPTCAFTAPHCTDACAAPHCSAAAYACTALLRRPRAPFSTTAATWTNSMCSAHRVLLTRWGSGARRVGKGGEVPPWVGT